MNCRDIGDFRGHLAHPTGRGPAASVRFGRFSLSTLGWSKATENVEHRPGIDPELAVFRAGSRPFLARWPQCYYSAEELAAGVAPVGRRRRPDAGGRASRRGHPAAVVSLAPG